MQLYLSHLKLDKYLFQDKPVNNLGNTDVTILACQEAWIQGDYTCKRVILGQLIDLFYALYSQEKTSKPLWLSLEKNHRAYVIRRQNFATAKFLHFRIVDHKPIVQQIEHSQAICCD
ncbi:hypothetical protein Bca4012_063506 [Brassica carinata]